VTGAEPALPAGLSQAFTVAAAELGMCTASWLFIKEIADAGGAPLVEAARQRLGRDFPVLDAVASAWVAGRRGPPVDVAPVVAACRGAKKLVVVGLETAFLDPLLPALPGVACALLQHSAFEVNWDRVLANFEGRLQTVDFDTFQAWAGPSSVLLTFAYGIHGKSTHVLPAWLRVTGEDVRTQFRSLIARDVLGAQMGVYPLWLVEVGTQAFTHLIPA
jgi:hypothetical protein